MTLASRPRSLAAPSALGWCLAVALFVLAAGCEDKHIGRVCELNIPDAGTPSTGSNATLNPQALECPSRTCLLAAKERSTDTGALCTAGCSSDDDCSDSEGGPKGDVTNDHRCESGFACVVPTTVGDFRCRFMCVCRDFLVIDPTMGYKKPTVCN